MYVVSAFYFSVNSTAKHVFFFLLQLGLLIEVLVYIWFCGALVVVWFLINVDMLEVNV